VAKIGRNASCRCGSGKKFKKCCLDRAVPPPRQGPPSDPWAIRISESVDQAGPQHGTLVPSILHKGHRVRAVRSQLYYRRPNETFHEFILEYLKWQLGEAWYKGQLALPHDERHQLLKWYRAHTELTRRAMEAGGYREGEVWSSGATGEVWALTTLAHDVIHLRHRGELPREVMERLRSYDKFQGARYEIAVAATFVRAGFRVEFIQEKARKHCEFITRLAGGPPVEIAVEAKSRHRPGVLHEEGPVDESRAARGDVEHLISQALEQDPGNRPFFVFVDLNVPLIPGIPIHERAWYHDVWELMQSMQTPTADRPDPHTAILLTNFSYHWFGTKPSSGGEYLFVASKYPRHSVPEDVLGRVIAAVASYGDVPGEV
jgi:SEC-C motif